MPHLKPIIGSKIQHKLIFTKQILPNSKNHTSNNSIVTINKDLNKVWQSKTKHVCGITRP